MIERFPFSKLQTRRLIYLFFYRLFTTHPPFGYKHKVRQIMIDLMDIEALSNALQNTGQSVDVSI